MAPCAASGGPGAPVADPPHDDAVVADAVDERGDLFLARAHLHADHVRGILHQPDDRVHVVRRTHVQEEAGAAVRAEPLGEGHVIPVGRLVIGHAGERHDEVHVRRSGQGRLPADELLGLGKGVRHDAGHQEPVAAHLFPGRRNDPHLVLEGEVVDQARARDTDHALPASVEMVVFHQVPDVPAVAVQVDDPAAVGYDGNGGDGVERVVQCFVLHGSESFHQAVSVQGAGFRPL